MACAVDLPAKTLEFVSAWGGFFFGATPAELSALHVISWAAGLENSTIAWYVSVSEKFRHGTSSLIDAMRADANADIALSSPVAAITHLDDHVEVRTRAGDTFSARAAVVATPVNTWHDLEISPGLNDAKQSIATERQAGHATKVWVLVDKMPGAFFGVGWGTKLNWLSTQYNTPDGDLVVGFGVSPARAGRQRP